MTRARLWCFGLPSAATRGVPSRSSLLGVCYHAGHLREMSRRIYAPQPRSRVLLATLLSVAAGPFPFACQLFATRVGKRCSRKATALSRRPRQSSRRRAAGRGELIALGGKATTYEVDLEYFDSNQQLRGWIQWGNIPGAVRVHHPAHVHNRRAGTLDADPRRARRIRIAGLRKAHVREESGRRRC